MALRSWLDVVTHEAISGWAWDSDAPDQPVSVVVTCDGQVLARCVAELYRVDLEQAGIGSGRHGFHARFSSSLSPWKRQAISVRREDDGTHLTGSPYVLGSVFAFDQVAQDAIAQVLSTRADEGELRRRLTFLADQTDKLRQTYADARSGADERRSRREGMWSEAGLTSAAGTDVPYRPRALVIDDHLPLAEHDAGSNAVLSHMGSLQRLGYDVTFAPATLHGDDSGLVASGIGSCLHPWYYSIEELFRRQHGGFALIYLHRVTTAARYVALARDHQPRARIVYSVADLHHLRLARQAEIEQRPDLAKFGEHVRMMELTAAWQSDAVITHSTAEADILRRHMRPEKVHVVPWSVACSPTAVPFTTRRGFAFIGSYGHRPNVDAALWLVDHVLPELSARADAIPCLLVGSDMPEDLRKLQRHGVDAIGYVPSLAAVFDRVRLTVAPLAYGAGVKGKVLDSLAAGVPCVCSPVAAEGLDLPTPLSGLMASTPAETAQAILRAHDDEALNHACREAGLSLIREEMSEDKVDHAMRAAVGLG